MAGSPITMTPVTTPEAMAETVGTAAVMAGVEETVVAAAATEPQRRSPVCRLF